MALTSDAWQRFKEKPSLMHFAERDYAWILPPGFDLYKAQQACSIFKVGIRRSHLLIYFASAISVYVFIRKC